MSKIEWTKETWNPVIGCSKISEGCRNCYAEKIACRLAHIDQTSYYADVLEEPQPMKFNGWNGQTALVESALDKPLRRKKPTVYFLCSMSDFFHDTVKTEWIDQVLEVIDACRQHTFLALTKRPWNINRKLYEVTPENPCRELGGGDYLPNLYIGVTAENQRTANERIPYLLQTQAAKRFVSIEPMLGPVDISLPIIDEMPLSRRFNGYSAWSLKIDQVIVGGESGTNARPMRDEWVRAVRDLCKENDTAFFYKQTSGSKPVKMPKLDGRIHDDLIWAPDHPSPVSHKSHKPQPQGEKQPCHTENVTSL